MRSPPALRIAALAAAMIAPTAAQAQLFKCVNSAGRTVYQDSPCSEADKQTAIRAPAPASAPAPAPAPGGEAKATPAAPAKAAAPAGPSAVDLVAGYAVCAEGVPNFAFKYSANYESWKGRNAASVDRLASEPDASRLDARLREERDKPEGLAERCATVATALLPPATAAK